MTTHQLINHQLINSFTHQLINSKMKYLLLTDAMSGGGAERQLAYLAMQLKKAGQQVRLVQFYDVKNHYGSDLEAAGISTESLTEGQNPLGRIRTISRLVKDWEPDRVITYKSGSGMAACIVRMTKKFNLIVSERNTTQTLSTMERVRFFLYRFADKIVPNSFSQEDFIREHFPKLMPKVKVITNMVDTEKFSPAETAKTPGEVPTVITTARIMPQKNPFGYVEAVKILKDRGIKAHFDWYGTNFDPEYTDKILRRVSELGIGDWVTFHAPTTDVVSLYRNADIFFLPSLYEGFPNVLCEAMACGLPSVTTAVCDSPRIMTDERFQADPHDPKSMADALERAIRLTPEERREIGDANRRRIVSLCSAEQFLNQYVAL